MSGNGDYISREDIVNGVSDLYWNSTRDYEPHEIILALHDMIADIPAADVRPRWIPVTERLPEAGERVLCYCRANIYEVMKMRTSGDWVYDVHHIYMHSFVTHWMPLPEPPKEE